MRVYTLLTCVMAVLIVSTGAYAETYTVDTTHADIGFKIKHLGINNVRGNFGEFAASVEYDGELEHLKFQADIKAASIDTGIKKRDDHLRAADYFDVEKYPDIAFVTKSVHAQGDKAHLTGILTMKGVSKEVSLNATVSGPVDSPFEEGTKIIALHAEGNLNRKDFGVGHDGASDKLIGDQVSIEINLEAKK